MNSFITSSPLPRLPRDISLCHIGVVYSFIIRCDIIFCQSQGDEMCYNNTKGGFNMETCTLCPRMCGVVRKQTDDIKGKLGFCKMSRTVRLAKAMLHEWEEPCISGSRGSGAVFSVGVISVVSIARITISQTAMAKM